MSEKDRQVGIINQKVKSVYVPTLLCFHYSKKGVHISKIQICIIHYLPYDSLFFYFYCLVQIYTLKKGEKGVDWDNIPEVD